MSIALENLLTNLKMEQLDDNLFAGTSIDEDRFRVYGGQVLGQAMMAAQSTVDPNFACHSLHSYFLRPGESTRPIVYQVTRARDGRSFATRRVEAIQKGKTICNIMMSFQVPEEGFEHQVEAPNTTIDPETLVPEQGFGIKLYNSMANDDTKLVWPIDIRFEDPIRFTDRIEQQPYARVWFKADGKLNDDPTIHKAVLTYASDSPILETACRPHPGVSQENKLFLATLDHTIWFHRPFRADEWMLYELESPNACGGRGFARANIFQNGVLIASAAQEGVMRAQMGEK